MKGEIAILNVGDGDTKLTVDTSTPEETEKSASVINDMIKRGFVLLVEVGRDDKGPLYRRVRNFDESTCEYIIAGSVEEEREIKPNDKKPASAPSSRRKGKAQREERIPAGSAKAVAVPRTAGG